MWFYRGTSGKKTIAHWFDPGAETSLCGRLKPDQAGVAWRHPVHDQHVSQCRHCYDKLAERKAKDSPTRPSV
jgi:hypothetical protein